MVQSRLLAFLMSILSVFPILVSGTTTALPLSADSCAISYALTGVVSAGCAEPDFETRQARSTAQLGGEGYFVHFDFNSNNLTAESQAHLSRLGALLNGNLSNLCVKLIGHTDTVGSAPYNLKLSMRRANSVRLFLAGPGTVSATRLLAEGQGEQAPLPGIPGDDGRNRRVEILARSNDSGLCR